LRLSREVKTGILAIGAILLFIFGYSYLKGTNLLEKRRTFYVKYENVEGLAKSAPVTINGFKVGKVSNIDFLNNRGGLVVEFTLEDDFSFSRNSPVRIYSAGLIGGKSLGIFPVYDASTVAVSGDTLKGEVEDGMLSAVTKALGPLERKVNNTLATVDTLLLAFTDIVDEPTRNNLKAAINSLNGTLQSLNGVSAKLNGVLANNTDKLDRTFTNLDLTTQNFAKLSDSLSKIEVGKMISDLENFTGQLNEIAQSIERGDGNLGKLLKEEQVYENLEAATKQLEELLEDLKLNPKRYVHFSLFGKKAGEYKAPEEPKK
jgi:phospholipid/cholesterol/gamma-HCH transport system substrate-binding protein